MLHKVGICNINNACHGYLAILWRVEDVNGTGFDAVGLGPSVKSEAALSAPTVSIWEGAIVPEEGKYPMNILKEKKSPEVYR